MAKKEVVKKTTKKNSRGESCRKKETTENSICGSFKRSHERNKAKAFVAAQNIPFTISRLFRQFMAGATKSRMAG